MCSQVRIKGQIKSLGDSVDVLTKDGQVSCILGGCAKSENYQSYWADVLERGELEADSYFEAGKEFTLQPGTRILVGVCTQDSKHHVTGEVLVITRPARSEVESWVHNRHPVIVEPSYSELVPC